MNYLKFQLCYALLLRGYHAFSTQSLEISMARPLDLQYGAANRGALHPEPPSEVHWRRPTQDEAQPSASDYLPSHMILLGLSVISS